MYKASYITEHWSYLSKAGKYPGVDTLRASAVLAVVMFHYRIIGLNYGWIGVDLFFVISGFLVGGAIYDSMNEGRFSFISFYKNRTLRIFPTYYLFIVLTALVNIAYFDSSTETLMSSTIMALSFTQTTLPYYFGVEINHAVVPGGSWSLVIEEYFYLLIPMILATTLSWRRRGVFLILAFIILLAPIIRLYTTSQFQPSDTNWHFANFLQFLSRFDELTVGVFVAILIRIKAVRNRTLWTSLGSLGLISFIIFLLVNQKYWLNPTLLTSETVWIPTLLSLSFGAIIVGLYQSAAPSWVVVIARLSYPLYLAHIWIGISAVQMGLISLDVGLASGDRITLRIVLMITSFLLAYIVSICLEYPFIRIYKKQIIPISKESCYCRDIKAEQLS